LIPKERKTTLLCSKNFYGKMNGLKILMKVMVLIFGQLLMTLSVQRRASRAGIYLGVLLQVVVMLLLLAPQPQQTYVRTRKHPRNAATIDICEDESDQQDEQPLQTESPQANEEGSESSGGEAAGDANQFHLDEDLLL
jgi:hypothetical protein